MKIKNIAFALLLCVVPEFTACAPVEIIPPNATQNIQNRIDENLDHTATPTENAPTSDSKTLRTPDGARPHNTKPTENIKKNAFFDVFIQDSRLEPDDQFSWNMDVNTFLTEIYTSDLMKPESEFFQEHRNTVSNEGITTLTPPVTIAFNDIDGDGSPQYFFDEDGHLFMVCFHYIFPANDPAEALTFMKSILANFASYGDIFTPTDEEPPVDMHNVNLANDLIKMRWNAPEGQQFFRITSVRFQEKIVIDLIIANHNYPGT